MYTYCSISAVHRLFDYVEEGGSDVKVTVIKNKTDPKIVWSFYPGWYNLILFGGEELYVLWVFLLRFFFIRGLILPPL